MLSEIYSTIIAILGLDLQSKDLSVWQMSARAFIVFLIAIGIIRLGDERFMGRHTALDVMLGIVFGSVVSRAITGNAPFFPTLAASCVLVAMHWAFSAIAFRSHPFGSVIKGEMYQLVKNGEIDWDTMRKADISERDLKEAMRQHGHRDDLESIDEAFLERNGSISIILRDASKGKAASNRPPND